jgi:ADP-dependent NAD(P)H-hydrate dehydratase / NAD(P)H-hydrate epimerase
MLPILVPAEAAALDRASEEAGVSVLALMEAAGEAVARAATVVAGGGYGRRAVVVCGTGNNGGDGLVAARLLERGGMGVTAVLLEDPVAFAGSARTNFLRFADGGGRWVGPDELERELPRADVAVDAIFGTGFRGTAQGAYGEAIRALRDGSAPVVAVDIPSGVEGESGAVRGDAVRAAATVVCGALKPGVVFEPGSGLAGRLEIADIGLPPGLLRSDLQLVEETDVSAWLPSLRSPSAHKRSSVVLVVAGSADMTGAAALCSTAAYRAGAGLVTVASAAPVVEVVRQRVPEATFLRLPETDAGSIDASGWDALRERLDHVDAVAIGPGLGGHDSTRELIRHVVRESPVPLVVDADALNAFAGDAGALAGRASDAVLTPHAGEFVRLMSLSATENWEGDRVELARKAVQETGCTVLLKGPRTLVATRKGGVLVNPTGGPSLATAGTGDVLTGTLAAMLSRGRSPSEAAAAAAYVHGLAGDLAAERWGEGAVASDVAALLPEAIRTVRAAGSG